MYVFMSPWGTLRSPALCSPEVFKKLLYNLINELLSTPLKYSAVPPRARCGFRHEEKEGFSELEEVLYFTNLQLCNQEKIFNDITVKLSER